MDTIDDLLLLYAQLKERIENQVLFFKNRWTASNDLKAFEQLIFCILTPQSKARMAERVINNINNKGIFFLYKASQEELSEELKFVRFKNQKAINIIKAREWFANELNGEFKKYIESYADSIPELRNILHKKIRGIGMKESSHFIRNIGKGENIAILDRHILKNMQRFEVIENIPATINEKKYLDLEQKLLNFSRDIKIPPDHMDFLLWYRETNDIFQ